jgi:superfamily II DNA or RNA helicase
MVTITKLNESFVQVLGDYDDLLNISNYFSFFANNYMWSPKFKSGIWDGKIRLLDRKTGKLPIGLYPRLKKFCQDLHIEHTIEFKKTSVTITDNNIIDYAKKKVKLDLELRDYQIEGIRTAFKDQKCIVISPTASGKSLIQNLVSQIFLDLNTSSKVLLIVPTVSLVEQMKGDFMEYAENSGYDIENDITTVYSGQERNWNRSIIISTWQSLQTIKDQKFFDMFGCVLVDEVHSAESGIIIQNIIGKCVNAKMKIGVSGTINDEVINRVQLEGLFGSIHQFTTTQELMAKGTLSNLKIQVLLLKYSDDLKRTAYKMPYHDEMTFLKDIDKRMNLIVKTAEKINKNILILFKHLDYGKMIYDRIVALDSNRQVFYVAGSTKSAIREEVRKLTNLDDNAIIVASLGVFATGINIPALDYCIFAQPFKSKIKVLQSIGRVLRKTDTKTKAVLIDIVDDLTWKRKRNYSLAHALQRIDIYDKEKFNYTITEINI